MTGHLSKKLYYGQVRLGVSNLAAVSGPVVTRTVREKYPHI